MTIRIEISFRAPSEESIAQILMIEKSRCAAFVAQATGKK